MTKKERKIYPLACTLAVGFLLTAGIVGAVEYMSISNTIKTTMSLDDPHIILEQSYSPPNWQTEDIFIGNVQWGIPYEIGARIRNNNGAVENAILEFKVENEAIISLTDFSILSFEILTSNVDFLTTTPYEIQDTYIVWQILIPFIPSGDTYEGSLLVQFTDLACGDYSFSATVLATS